MGRQGAQDIGETGEIDFLATEQEMDIEGDLEEVDLFGVPLDGKASEQDEQGLKEVAKVFTEQLIEMFMKLDPDGHLAEFEKPNTFISMDPGAAASSNSSQLFQQIIALKYEDNIKLRASLIMDAYSKQL